MTATSERRTHDRGRLALFGDLFFGALRASYRRVHSFGAALGIFLVAGALLAAVLTTIFVRYGSYVRSGATQRLDEAILRRINEGQHPLLDGFMLEITMLGTWTVVMTTVSVAAMFLWLNRHKYSAILLLVATVGGTILNNILKLAYDRPRPQVFEWKTHALSSSFPSGHSMSAVVVYGTVAYLAARLQKKAWARWLTLVVAGLLIGLICFSRMYLGVHYPSDVLAGMTMGLGWAAFCMATLEAFQKFAMRNARQVLKDEEPTPKQKEEIAEVRQQARGDRRAATA